MTLLQCLVLFPYHSQSSQNICSFNTPIATPPVLDNVEDVNFILSSTARINLYVNYITASTAAVVDSFSFVFVAYTDRNGNHFLSGVSTLIFHSIIFSMYMEINLV